MAVSTKILIFAADYNQLLINIYLSFVSMKKIMTIVAVLAVTMMAYSCKNANNQNGEEAAPAEECCGECGENGECTKAEGEKCDACLEAEAASAEEAQELATISKASLESAAEALGETIIEAAAVEVKPLFEGGDANSFQKWVSKNIKYPESAIQNNEQGKVFVNFVVDKEGKITNAKVLKGVSEAIDAEALRVIQSAPAWTPAQQNGKNVPVNYTMPIVFALN